MSRERNQLPKKRAEGLVEAVMADEIVLYDERAGTAHALNGPASAVWQGLSAGLTRQDLAVELQAKFGGSGDAALTLALNDLSRQGLLEVDDGPLLSSVSRRQLLRGLVAAGVVAPVVASIATVHAGGAAVSIQTCTTPGCTGNCIANKPCCSCAVTAEGPNACVQISCLAAQSCNASSECPSGQICVQTSCCNGLDGRRPSLSVFGFCRPACTVNTVCSL